MEEYDFEPIPGLPATLPADERILWQGAPEWRALARRALHVWKVTLYCAIILAWNGTAAVMGGATIGEAIIHTLWISPLPLLAIGILLLLGWLYARTTIYTLTNKRLVVRSGVALPITVNIPFRLVESAGVRTYRDGTGDINFVLNHEDRAAYVQLWPNVRPWHFNHPQPMLRTVDDPQAVAEIVSRALQDFAYGTEAAQPRVQREAGSGRARTMGTTPAPVAGH
ncbi:MAG: PH domain-containing protein [Geminicoccaceae bacterium]|nr:MAG: PH domain-containing protein [Geminicoccaceae bacterium]